MICKDCGSEIADGSQYCVYCGARVGNELEVNGQRIPLSTVGNSSISANQVDDDIVGHGDTVMYPRVSSSPQRARRSSFLGVPVVTVGIALLVISGAVAYFVGRSGGSKLATALIHRAQNPVVSGTEIAATSDEASSGLPISEDSAEGPVAATSDAADLGSDARSSSTPLNSESLTAAVPAYSSVTPSAETGKYGYILPDAPFRFYTREELGALSLSDVWLASNEIYARHGRMFKDEGLQKYFDSKSWYMPLYEPDVFDSMGDQFNEYERGNLDLLVSIRSEG